MPSYRRLQQYAIAISAISILYNGAEGGVSIGFGVETSSRSLIFFGIQSGIEVISAILVIWRFKNVAKPGEEKGVELAPEELRFEKLATIGIGLLLWLLAIATVATSISTLVLHQEPDSSNASLIISASALVLMILIWLPKRYLAKALDSSTMRGETACSLSCIQLTCVLFVGSLLFRVWRGGWWVDAATSIALAGLFAWEGQKMVTWATSVSFNGGCCDACKMPSGSPLEAELGEMSKDICQCCSEKEECRNSDECQCAAESKVSVTCCDTSKDRASGHNKCCTRQIISNPRQIPNSAQFARDDGDLRLAEEDGVKDGDPCSLSSNSPKALTAAASPSSCCQDCCQED